MRHTESRGESGGERKTLVCPRTGRERQTDRQTERQWCERDTEVSFLGPCPSQRGGGG